MPGYPTKKLLFGGPETRTKAAMLRVSYEGNYRLSRGRDRMD